MRKTPGLTRTSRLLALGREVGGVDLARRISAPSPFTPESTSYPAPSNSRMTLSPSPHSSTSSPTAVVPAMTQGVCPAGPSKPKPCVHLCVCVDAEMAIVSRGLGLSRGGGVVWERIAHGRPGGDVLLDTQAPRARAARDDLLIPRCRRIMVLRIGSPFEAPHSDSGRGVGRHGLEKHVGGYDAGSRRASENV